MRCDWVSILLWDVVTRIGWNWAPKLGQDSSSRRAAIAQIECDCVRRIWSYELGYIGFQDLGVVWLIVLSGIGIQDMGRVGSKN